MPLPLPNPSTWGDYSDILQNIMQNKLKGQEQAETAKYHQGELEVSRGNLGVAQAAEARARQLMPFLIQQYKDAHGKEMSEMQMNNLYNGIIRDAYNSAPTTAAMNPPIQPAVPVQSSFGQAPANDTSMINQFMQPAPQNFTPVSAPAAPSAQPAGQAPVFPAGTPVPAFSPIAQQLPALNAPAPAPMPAPGSQQNAFPKNENGEEIIRPGNPQLNKLDAIAGLPKSPIAAPETTFDKENGYIYTKYPSGKITRQKMSENQEAEEYRGTNPQERKLNQAEAIKIKSDSNDILKAAEVATKMKKLLDENPDLTGMHNFLSSKTKLLNDKKKGQFINLAGILQSTFGRMASSRGGAQALAWAKSVKPDLLTGQETNKGMLDATLAQLQDELKNNKERYNDFSFKPLDVKLPEYKGATVTIIDSNGDEHEIDADKVDVAKQRDPGLKVKE